MLFCTREQLATRSATRIRSLWPGVIAVQPDGGKLALAQAVQPFVEAGNVYLPDPRPHGTLVPERQWVEEFVHQLTVGRTTPRDDADKGGRPPVVLLVWVVVKFGRPAHLVFRFAACCWCHTDSMTKRKPKAKPKRNEDAAQSAFLALQHVIDATEGPTTKPKQRKPAGR